MHLNIYVLQDTVKQDQLRYAPHLLGMDSDTKNTHVVQQNIYK